MILTQHRAERVATGSNEAVAELWIKHSSLFFVAVRLQLVKTKARNYNVLNVPSCRAAN